MSMVTNEDEPRNPSADRIAALGSLYGALVSSTATAASLTAALLGAVVVYITAAIAFIDQILKASVLAGALLPAELDRAVAYGTTALYVLVAVAICASGLSGIRMYRRCVANLLRQRP